MVASRRPSAFVLACLDLVLAGMDFHAPFLLALPYHGCALSDFCATNLLHLGLDPDHARSCFCIDTHFADQLLSNFGTTSLLHLCLDPDHAHSRFCIDTHYADQLHLRAEIQEARNHLGFDPDHWHNTFGNHGYGRDNTFDNTLGDPGFCLEEGQEEGQEEEESAEQVGHGVHRGVRAGDKHGLCYRRGDLQRNGD